MKRTGKIIINKKLIFVFLISALLVSCFQENRLITEYYETGELYRKFSVNKLKELDGEYYEYYKNGKVKIFTIMADGHFLDSLSYFNRNGILVAKGIMKKNNLRLGWWRELDSIKGKVVFRDYAIVDDTNYINQEIYLNDKFDTIYSKSRFFRLDFKNELKQGENIARVSYLNGVSNSNSYMTLVLNNFSKKENDTLIFNKENVCYFPYEYQAKNNNFKVKITESVYLDNNSIYNSKLQVKYFNILFDLQLGKASFFGESYYDDSTPKLISPSKINPFQYRL
ncbi:MAG: hypothetical protein COZ75_07260 [Flavobacteriaceae bacterium CG_4_8_14_3_um_filter_34_10]|nr:MAG: hypothetical protein COS19_00840 [Flavobacteriaceae bacterium CG02_land_8_20_14_3_00_34_13]PIX09346.1 MAG: hypothetical protein COZ75_07260 [Flavobacteriaceae bacterium CG_4_8_14_3_um_filter_34_10]